MFARRPRGSPTTAEGRNGAAAPSSTSAGGDSWKEFFFCCDPRQVAGAVEELGTGGLPSQDNNNTTSRDLDSAEQRGEITELSPAASAAYKALRMKHFWHYKRQWGVSTGRVVAVHATPRVQIDAAPAVGSDDETLGAAAADEEAPSPALVTTNAATLSVLSNGGADLGVSLLPAGHSDWFPQRLGDVLADTEEWCDVLNLGPPDGLFMDAFADAIVKLHNKNKTIVVRMMFGNVLGIGNVNCRAVVDKLTASIPNPESTKLRLWVGAWRKGVSWNHAKIMAVDGNLLITGGHNLWDEHYLKRNPVLDLSMELEGPVAQDAHLFANEQWSFVEKLTTSSFGIAANRVQSSRYAPVVFKSFITLKRYPPSVARHPPNYVRQHQNQLQRRPPTRRGPAHVPVLSMGRCGAVTPLKRRPSDDAIVAMLESAKTSIRLALQDLGPVCIPGTKITLPGCIWPKGYLNALGRVLWTTRAQIEILLSNPLSVPGDLTMMQAVYGNGWTCVDVAAEIIKTVLRQYPIAAKLKSSRLREKVATQIRVSYLRGPDGSTAWSSGKGATRAFHAKHFVVDDRAFYIGSQNLYISDLAEWGVVVDNADATQQVLKEFWDPLWKLSYRPEDCDVQGVMDGLRIGRNGESPIFMSASTRKLVQESAQSRQSAISSKASAIIAAARVVNALQAERTPTEGVEVLASALPSTSSSSPPPPEKREGKGAEAGRRFRALGQIAVLAQSQPPIGINNQDLYYADDEEAELRGDADEGPAPDDNGASSPLAKITALKYLARRQMRRNTV